jgi:putative RNA 2'-phosphotransferase
MAERMGKRIDTTPVVLTVHVEKSRDRNVVFYQLGQSLFLVEGIPPGCFTGPPLPKEKPEPKEKPDREDAARKHLAGSFHVDVEQIRNKQYGKGRKKEIPWKLDRKRQRKTKHKPW